jgi:hypothetical protein
VRWMPLTGRRRAAAVASSLCSLMRGFVCWVESAAVRADAFH